MEKKSKTKRLNNPTQFGSARDKISKKHQKQFVSLGKESKGGGLSKRSEREIGRGLINKSSSYVPSAYQNKLSASLYASRNGINFSLIKKLLFPEKKATLKLEISDLPSDLSILRLIVSKKNETDGVHEINLNLKKEINRRYGEHWQGKLRRKERFWKRIKKTTYKFVWS